MRVRFPGGSAAAKALFVLVAFCVGVASLVTPREVGPVMVTGASLVVFPFVLNFRCSPKWQAQRRLLHMATGTLIVYMSHKVGREILYNSLFMLTLGAAVIEVARRRISSAGRLFKFFFGNLLRPNEAAGVRIPGAFYFLPGAAACLFFFPLPAARLGILALAFGDPAAGFFGALQFRKLNFAICGKSLFGFLACALFGGLACTAHQCMVSGLPFSVGGRLGDFVLFATLAGVSESLALLDDNLTMPSLFAFLLHLARSSSP